ncbi:MAG TPA: hydrogenase maturation nickel metallochaperone HypA [Candidatus Desulfaltia sp.]|nr:hydrogenase maturation nickel metallochaperone HypA [Candidatus Desulfaltia sp.]
MHELSIVASLFEILEEKAREQKAARVVRVSLKVGKLAGVVPEFLQTAFDSYKRDTIAAEAALEVTLVPLRVKCRKCRAVTEKDDFVFTCSACGSTELEVLEGTELLLDKLDLEV